MVISESTLHGRSRDYHSNGRHIPVQRTTIEPASGRSSYYPHESTSYYNTGSRGGGGGSSVTYVLPSSNGHKRYGSTTQLPSPLKYASLSRRNSGNVGGQSLVVPRAGSRFASPVVGEFSHELSQRSPGIPPPCPELPTPADRGHLAPHLPSNYSGRAHGAMRSYHHFGQEQAFVEIAGAKRPSTLPIGMHASSHRYSPSALPRASTFSELSITDAPEPSPSRAHTFNCAYNTPAIYEPVPPLPTSYLPQASPSSTLYDPHSSTFAPSYQDCPEYPESSTETFVNPEEDPYTNPFDYSTSGRYARDYSLPVDSSAYQPSFGTPQEETGTPFDSDSDTIFDSTVNHESEFDQFVEKVSIEHHAPAASVDTSYKLPSPPLSYATTTGTTGRYASTGKPKPAPIIVEPLPEHKPVAAKPSRRNPYSNMAAPGVKAPHFDTSTLTPEEQDDEYSRNDGLDDFCSPSPNSLHSYVPMSNLPTPPQESLKATSSRDLTNEPLRTLLEGGLTERQLIGGAKLLAEKCPASKLFSERANPLKIRQILIPARLSMIVLVMAASILEHLDSEFVEYIAAECDRMQPQGVLCPNMVVVAALAIAYKYQADKSYTTEFWKNELNHVNQDFAPKGAIAREITRRMCATYERELLIALDHRLLAIENNTADMRRIRLELEDYAAKEVESTPNGFANAIGLGRYTKHTSRK